VFTMIKVPTVLGDAHCEVASSNRVSGLSYVVTWCGITVDVLRFDRSSSLGPSACGSKIDICKVYCWYRQNGTTAVHKHNQ